MLSLCLVGIAVMPSCGSSPQSVPGINDITDVAIDSDLNRLYVLMQIGHPGRVPSILSVIDTAERKVVGVLDVGFRAHTIAVDSDRHLAYVFGDDTVAVLDGQASRLRSTIPTGGAAYRRTTTIPRTNRIYALNGPGVDVLDAVTLDVLDRITIPDPVQAVPSGGSSQRLSSFGPKGLLPIPGNGEPESKSLSLSDIAVESTGKQLHVLFGFEGGIPVDASPLEYSGQLATFDLKSGKRQRSVSVPGGLSGQVVIDQAMNTAYIAFDFLPYFSAVDLVRGEVVWLDALEDLGARQLGIDQALGFVYVADSGGALTILDIKKRTVVSKTRARGGLAGLAVDTRQHRIYVVNASGTVSILDGKTGVPLGFVDAGRIPDRLLKRLSRLESERPEPQPVEVTETVDLQGFGR